MLLTFLFFIYLLVGIRIGIFHAIFLFNTYLINKRGYIVLNDNNTKLIITDAIPVLPFFFRSIFAVFFWPFDAILAPRILSKVFILFDSKAMANLSKFYAKTNPFIMANRGTFIFKLLGRPYLWKLKKLLKK